MSGQLDLLAPEIAPIAIEPTREVLHRGANAATVPLHEHVPSPRPKAMHTDEEWLLVLRVAEEQIRWRSWTRPHPIPLDERPEECVGGRKGCWYDSKGVAIGEGGAGRYATWSSLLRGLREQREREPHIADARDLAHAYSAVETYDHFYVRDGGSVWGSGTPKAHNEWREEVAKPHLAELRKVVVTLGGDPDFQASLERLTPSQARAELSSTRGGGSLK